MNILPEVTTPAGTVTLFAGNTVPGATNAPLIDLEALGWMVADGRVLTPEAYPELFATIGERFGAPKEGSFRIPDFSGAPRPPKTTYIIKFR